MRRFASTAFIRTLAICAVTSLAGCDDSSLDDLEELDEPRAAVPPTAGIPADYTHVKNLFSIPMQPVAKYKPKSGFALHPPTNPAYIWTPDPFEAGAILTDANGASPYGVGEPPEAGVCEAFLADHPFYVPILHPEAATCAEMEKSCCDLICYNWGGWPKTVNNENSTTTVKHSSFAPVEIQDLGGDLGMVWGSFVTPGHLTWNMDLPYGGHSERSIPCACECIIDPEAIGDTDDTGDAEDTEGP